MQKQVVRKCLTGRERLVEATIQSIYRYGLSDTSVATVTEIAGLSRGMVRRGFLSKNAMLIAAYESILAEWSENFFAIKGDSPLETVILMVESMFCPPNFEPLKVTAWMAFSVACLHDPKLREIWRRENATWRDAICSELRACSRESGVDFDAEALADTILATTDGLWLRQRIESDRLTPHRARELITKMVLAQVRPDSL